MEAADVGTWTRLVPLILAAHQLTEEPVLHQVLTALAGADGRAAARALADAEVSSNPSHERLQAITLLRSAYEKYLVVRDAVGFTRE